MIRHTGLNGTDAWLQLINKISSMGNEVFPRGIATKEILGNQTIVDMNDPIVLIKERKVSYNFMFAEAWWMLTGRNDVESLLPYSPSIGKFSDNGLTFDGAYGPRIVDQLGYVINQIGQDNDTRQAVMTIFSPNPKPSKDIPCTISLDFKVRNHRLHCFTTMRSSDAWIGYIYDIFNFSAISAFILIELKSQFGLTLDLGNLYLTAASQHLYADKWDSVESICRKFNPLRHSPVCEFSEAVNNCDTGADFIKFLHFMKDNVNA